MSIAKAKLYKTARIIRDTELFKAGEFVSVRYAGQGSFGLNFTCKLDVRTEVMPEYDLDDFCL